MKSLTSRSVDRSSYLSVGDMSTALKGSFVGAEGRFSSGRACSNLESDKTKPCQTSCDNPGNFVPLDGSQLSFVGLEDMLEELESNLDFTICPSNPPSLCSGEETVTDEDFAGLWMPSTFDGSETGDIDLMALDLDEAVLDFALNQSETQNLDGETYKRSATNVVKGLSTGKCTFDSIGTETVAMTCTNDSNCGRSHGVEDRANSYNSDRLESTSNSSSSLSVTSRKCGTRQKLDIHQKPLMNKPQKFSRWTIEEDELLLSAIEIESGDKINWKLISMKYFNGTRNVNQCKGRWKKQLRPGVKRSAWTEEEDRLVRKYKQLEMSFPEIGAKIGRVSDQVRDRWMNVLDPELKKHPITREERQIIFEAQQRLGNKWKAIANLLPGRSENMVKNCFHNAKMATRRKMRKAAAAVMKQKKTAACDLTYVSI